jgi:hypothetical protein
MLRLNPSLRPHIDKLSGKANPEKMEFTWPVAEQIFAAFFFSTY